MNDMDVYLGKDRQQMAQQLTATHPAVTNMTRRVEGVSHKLYMDNFSSSHDLFDDLAPKKLPVVGLRLHRKAMYKDLTIKRHRLKQDDI